MDRLAPLLFDFLDPLGAVLLGRHIGVLELFLGDLLQLLLRRPVIGIEAEDALQLGFRQVVLAGAAGLLRLGKERIDCLDLLLEIISDRGIGIVGDRLGIALIGLHLGQLGLQVPIVRIVGQAAGQEHLHRRQVAGFAGRLDQGVIGAEQSRHRLIVDPLGGRRRRDHVERRQIDLTGFGIVPRLFRFVGVGQRGDDPEDLLLLADLLPLLVDSGLRIGRKRPLSRDLRVGRLSRGDRGHRRQQE